MDNEGQVKECSKCGLRKSLDSFRIRSDNGKPRNECRECENARNKTKTVVKKENEPKEAPTFGELAKRMWYGAKQRSKAKGVPFDLEIGDIVIPPICPVLRIPIIPNVEGALTDNSPTLDRKIPHLGYTKGNVKVVSNRCNRLKSNGNSRDLFLVYEYVKQLEDELL